VRTTTDLRWLLPSLATRTQTRAILRWWHIHAHGVREDEVEQVLERPGEDRAGRDGSRVAIGQTRAPRQTTSRVPAAAQEEVIRMTQKAFPPGWDEERVRKVLAHYESQSEDEAVAEDEAAAEGSETIMSVPKPLVPAVRELIAKHRRQAGGGG
jgi:hypothetical protein